MALVIAAHDMTTEPAPIQRFDAFTLDRANRALLRDGQAVDIGSRYFDALVLLVDNRGELVSKDRFMDEVWRGIPVTDEALTQCIRALRRALGDEASNPRFIETVPKHGYRFLAPPPVASEAETGLPLSRLAGACTLGGLAAGIVGGLVYGVLAGTGGGAGVLMLAAMVGALGLLGGAGLGTGMAATLGWRGKVDPAMIGGAMVGGLLVGALGNMLGREGLALLTGEAVGAVTGPFEGVVLGIATGTAAWLALSGKAKRMVLLAAPVIGALAGAAIHLAGGTILAESLWSVQLALPGFQLEMERLGLLTGSHRFTALAQAVTAMAESALFTEAMALAALIARRGSPRTESD